MSLLELDRPMDARILDNHAWKGAKPQLSVLIPFFRDDPCRLLATLETEAALCEGMVEIVLLDDGGGDAALAARAAATVRRLALPIRFVSLFANEGRARGRNRLAAHARADSLLFLDSDMLPDRPVFLRTWLDLIERERPAVAFGGFSVDQAPSTPAHALHRAMAARADCLPAKLRARTPEKYVFTSNLLVRRDVFDAETFDEGFTGWGWEDVEWGARVSRRFGVIHIDNPATHLGLDTAQALARKYEQSAANFARLAGRHPEVVHAYPSYRLARFLKRAPGLKLWRRALKQTALASAAPLPARVAAMKAYRAALYAEVV